MPGYNSNASDSSRSRRQWQYERGPSLKWLRFRFWLKKLVLLSIILGAIAAIVAIVLIPKSIPPLEIRYNAIDDYKVGRVEKIVIPRVEEDKLYFKNQGEAASNGSRGRKIYEFLPNEKALTAVPFREFLQYDVFKAGPRQSPIVLYLSVFGQVREAEPSAAGENADSSAAVAAGLIFTDGGVVTIKEILDLIGNQPRPVILCLDVTRARTRVSAGHFAQDFTIQLRNEYEQHASRKNAWILCAANDGEWSWAPSTSQPSAFVKSIVDGLLGGADTSTGGDNSKTAGNERVEVGELFSYVKQQTIDWALRYRGVEQNAIFLHPEASNWDALVLTTYGRRIPTEKTGAETAQGSGPKDEKGVVKEAADQSGKAAEQAQAKGTAEPKKETVAEGASEKKQGGDAAAAQPAKAESKPGDGKNSQVAGDDPSRPAGSVEADDLKFPVVFDVIDPSQAKNEAVNPKERFQPLLKAKLAAVAEATKAAEKPAAPGDAKVVPSPDPEIKKLEGLLKSDLLARRDYQQAAWNLLIQDLAASAQPMSRSQALIAEIQASPQHPPEFDLAAQLVHQVPRLSDSAVRKKLASALTLEANARRVVLVEDRVVKALEERKLWSSKIKELEIHRGWIREWLLHGWDGKEEQQRDRLVQEVEDHVKKAQDVVDLLDGSAKTISAALQNVQTLPAELFRYGSWAASYSDFCVSGPITPVAPTGPDANPYAPISWSEDREILTPLSELFSLYRQLRRELKKNENNLAVIGQLNEQIKKLLPALRQAHAERLQRAIKADESEVKSWHLIDRMLGDPGLTIEQQTPLREKQQRIDELREGTGTADRLPGNFTNTNGMAACLWGIQILSLSSSEGNNSSEPSVQNLWSRWKDYVNAVNQAAQSEDGQSSKSTALLGIRASLGTAVSDAWSRANPDQLFEQPKPSSGIWRSRLTDLRRKIPDDSRFASLAEARMKVEVGAVTETPGLSARQQRTVIFRQKKTDRPSIPFVVYFDPAKVIAVSYRNRSHALSPGERFDETWEDSGDGDVILPLTVVQERAASAPDAWLVLATDPHAAGQDFVPPQVSACRIPGITDYSKWQVQFKAVPKEPESELTGISLLDREQDKPIVKMFLPPVSGKEGFQAKAFLIRPAERSPREETVQLSIFRTRDNQQEILKDKITVKFPSGPVNEALDSPSVLQEIPLETEPEKPGTPPAATPAAGSPPADPKAVWDQVDSFTIDLKLADEQESTRFQVLPTIFDIRQAQLLSVRAVREGQTFSLEYNLDSESHLRGLLRAFYPRTIPATVTLSNSQNLIDSQQSETTSISSVKKMDWQKLFEAKFLRQNTDALQSPPQASERTTPLECSVNLGGVPQLFVFRQMGTSRDFEILMRPQLRIVSPKNGDCFERGKGIDFKFEVDELDSAASVQLEMDGNPISIDVLRPRRVQILEVKNGVWTFRTLNGEFSHKLATDFLGRKNITATLKTAGKKATANVHIGVDTPMDSPQFLTFAPITAKSDSASSPLPRDRDVTFKISASDPQSGITGLAIALDKNGDEKLGDDEKPLVERKYDLASQQGENWDKPDESLTISIKSLAAELGDMPSDENKVLKFVARATNGLKQVSYRALPVAFTPPPKPLASVVVKISNCPKRDIGVALLPANGSEARTLSRTDEKMVRWDKLPVGKYKVIVYPKVSPENLFLLENPMDAAFELTKEHTPEQPQNVHVIIMD